MADESPQKPDATGHETRDINARAVAWFGLGLVITFLVIFLMARWLLGIFGAQHSVGTAVTQISGQQMQPPQPRLQSNPAGDMARFRAWENGILTNYSWVDRPAGVVRIPIERAMDLIAERGLPAQQFSSGKTPLQMRQEKANAEKPSP